MIRLYIRVSGRVQGVGFRWFTSMTAARLNLTGWVRNREDGDVVSRGPRYAVVENMERHPLVPEPGERSFHERGSLW